MSKGMKKYIISVMAISVIMGTISTSCENRKENKSKEKLCLFFASDYHFEMISLPYINENLKQNKNVVIVTENNLKETVDKLLSRVNLTEEEKNNILKIDWQNNDSNKLKEIKKANEENKEIIVFVKGKEDYIDNINRNIKSWIYDKEIEVIDCYDINEVHNNVSKIAGKYNRVLSTSGVEKLL